MMPKFLKRRRDKRRFEAAAEKAIAAWENRVELSWEFWRSSLDKSANQALRRKEKEMMRSLWMGAEEFVASACMSGANK